MLPRKLLVRLTLAALAASAATGLAVLFVPGWSVTGRLALSAAGTVICCGLLLVFCGQEDRGKATPLQIVWTVWVTGLLSITLGFLWLERLMPGRQGAALLWAWAVYGLGAFIVAFPALRARSREGERACPLSERLSLAGAVAGFVAGSVCMLVRPWSDLALFGGLLALTLALLPGLGAVCALTIRVGPRAGMVHPRDRAIGWFGVAISGLTMAAWIAVLLQAFAPCLADGQARPADPSLDLTAASIAGSALAMALSLWCALHPLGFRGWSALLPPTSALLTLLLGGMAALAASGRLGLALDGSLFSRAMFAVLLLDCCTLLAIPVAMRMGRSMRGSHDFVQRVDTVRTRCPRCRSVMLLRPGENACDDCGLVTLIEFRDDRCPGCDYDLRRTVADACPECGRARQVPGAAQG